MRRWIPLGLLILAAAAPDPAVYTCRVPVTGTDTRNRPEAEAACLRQVLVKLSGDPAIAGKPLPSGAAVTGFAYLDLMTDIPLHDEQGTRDRPFEFVGRVDPGWAETAVLMDGAVPWTAPRPVLRVQVEVTDMKGNRFTLTGDGARGERQRRALLDSADLFALPVSLPAEGGRRPGALPRAGRHAALERARFRLGGRLADGHGDLERAWRVVRRGVSGPDWAERPGASPPGGR